MRVTVFGANGQTGHLLVRQALHRGDQVTAVVRDPNRLSTHDPALTLVTIPDLADPAEVAHAVEGADAVLSAVGPRGRKDGPVAAPATASMLTALTASAVSRIVVISAAPVGAPPREDSVLNRRILMPMVSAMLRPVYADLRAMEAELAASDTAWTAFRPPKLTNGSLTSRYRTAVGSSVPRGYSLSRDDLAHAMLAAIDDPETLRATVGIAY